MSKVGRNESCPCGSGRKYKKCHGAPTMELASGAAAGPPPSPPSPMDMAASQGRAYVEQWSVDERKENRVMTEPVRPEEKPKTYIATIVEIANECLLLADDVCDAAVDAHTEFAGLAAACLARAAQSLMSVAELAQRGLVGDAMSVARTIVELTIDLGYIASNPEVLVRRFVDYADVRRAALAEAIEDLHGGKVNQEAMRTLRERRDEYLEENPNSEHSWAAVGNQRRGLRWRAEHVAGDEATRRQYVQLYDLLYGDMCGASHSGQVTLEYTMQRGHDGAQVIHFGHQLPDAKPIRLGVGTLIQMMSLILQTCTLKGFDDRFHHVWQAITEAHPPP